MKTTLLVFSLAVSAVVMWLFTREWRNVLPAFAGVLVVPAILAAYFAAKGAWKNLVYCVIEFNAQIAQTTPRTDLLLKSLAYFPVLFLILWVARLRRPSSDDPTV